MQIEISKRHGESLYKFVVRNRRVLETFEFDEIVKIINNFTIDEAAKRLGMDSIQLLIFVGHLYTANIVREVRIV